MILRMNTGSRIGHATRTRDLGIAVILRMNIGSRMSAMDTGSRMSALAFGKCTSTAITVRFHLASLEITSLFPIPLQWTMRNGEDKG